MPWLATALLLLSCTRKSIWQTGILSLLQKANLPSLAYVTSSCVNVYNAEVWQSWNLLPVAQLLRKAGTGVHNIIIRDSLCSLPRVIRRELSSDMERGASAGPPKWQGQAWRGQVYTLGRKPRPSIKVSAFVSFKLNILNFSLMIKRQCERLPFPII